ncbi:DUF932 domain-containing protein [Aquabacterium sp.]|uniref:DUF932 domain-containing protein n=1 Tax=Aquabacterium sp. TaxID=1872578 RepID=UPI0025C70AAB|nr:DUF932 domain-containing protein [Aquabacterium sp.]
MSHQIEKMAYVGATPWHKLGSQLQTAQPIEIWAKHAGMDWSICEAPVRYTTDIEDSPESLRSVNDQKVLFRSDTKAALSVVGSRYKVVQPQAVLEFYRDLVEISGFELETAGVLKGGRKFWALARTGKSTTIKGSDVVNGYILLASSCDGTLATVATPTTIRVVCNNTLAIALGSTNESIKVPHSTTFDAHAVKMRLGIAVSRWDDFMYQMKALSRRCVKSHEAKNYFLRVMCPPVLAAPSTSAESNVANERALKAVQALYDGQGRGAELASAQGTAWGLLNAVTEYVDHARRARSQEHRLDSAWFGQGAGLKQRALEHALQLVS